MAPRERSRGPEVSRQKPRPKKVPLEERKGINLL